MKTKSILAIPFAKVIQKRVYKWAANPVKTQEKVFKKLIRKAAKTKFGQDHRFNQISSHSDFKKNVPVRDYEGLKQYIELILKGQRDVLWKGMPLYFAKTSGTTSGAKYIPLTKASMPCHTKAARNAILLYIAETGNAQGL